MLNVYKRSTIVNFIISRPGFEKKFIDNFFFLLGFGVVVQNKLDKIILDSDSSENQTG